MPLSRDANDDRMFPDGMSLIDGMEIAEAEKDRHDMMKPTLMASRRPVIKSKKVRKVKKNLRKTPLFRRRMKRL